MIKLKTAELTQRWIGLLGLMFEHAANGVRRQTQNQVRDQVLWQIEQQAESRRVRELRFSIRHRFYENFDN